MDKPVSNTITYLFVLLFISLVAISALIYDLGNAEEENTLLTKEIKEKTNEINFLRKVVLKGANRDSLYREHMGKTLYIDNNSVEVGYDNYLRLKNNKGF